MSEDAPALLRLLDVVGRLGAERRSEPVLRSILDAARDLAGARYAAVGVPDGDGGFALFLTAGVDSETWDRIGSLPRTHGLLGALLELRELSIVDERTRIARDLHDSVTQTLFSLTLAAESAATVAGVESPAQAHLDRVRELSRTALDELGALVDTLRPPDVDADGLDAALRKRVDLLRAVHDVPILLEVRGRGGRCAGEVGREVLKVANEAISNALQHASPQQIRVRLDLAGAAARLRVSDDGRGFDLAATARNSRRLGLASMRERAEALGGTLQVDTAPGAGTTVTLEVPAG